jgi:hypothetical protein
LGDASSEKEPVEIEAAWIEPDPRSPPPSADDGPEPIRIPPDTGTPALDVYELVDEGDVVGTESIVIEDEPGMISSGRPTSVIPADAFDEARNKHPTMPPVDPSVVERLDKLLKKVGKDKHREEVITASMAIITREHLPPMELEAAAVLLLLQSLQPMEYKNTTVTTFSAKILWEKIFKLLKGRGGNLAEISERLERRYARETLRRSRT